MSSVVLQETWCSAGQGSSWLWKGRRAQVSLSLAREQMAAASRSVCYSLLSCSLSPLCWKVGSLCRPGREHGAYSSAAVIQSLVAQHKPPLSQSWGVVKSQRKIHQCSYPHFLLQLPSDIPSRGNVGIISIALVCHGCTLHGYPVYHVAGSVSLC